MGTCNVSGDMVPFTTHPDTGERVNLPTVAHGNGGAFVFIPEDMRQDIAEALTHYHNNGPRHRSTTRILAALRRINEAGPRAADGG